MKGCVVIYSHIHSTGVSVVPSAAARWEGLVGTGEISTYFQGIKGTVVEPDSQAEGLATPVLSVQT